MAGTAKIARNATRKVRLATDFATNLPSRMPANEIMGHIIHSLRPAGKRLGKLLISIQYRNDFLPALILGQSLEKQSGLFILVEWSF